jgi:serine/threonine protein kinase
MNYKKSVNGHYNADQSRDLLDLINEIDETKALLERAGISIEMDPEYRSVLEICKTFLQQTQGSSIPDSFQRIQIKKYDPIFWSSERHIVMKNSSQLTELKHVGEGSYAIVHSYRDPTYGFMVAMKTAKKSLTPRELERFKREFDILKGLSNPYILKVYNFDDEKNRYTMEYCDWNLNDFIAKKNQMLTFGMRVRIANQFLSGLNYLHTKDILHRDLSRYTVLIQGYEFPAVLVKLSDFGLHKDPSSEFTKTGTSMKGSITDPALESFKDFSVTNEIYAVGFLLSFIFSGRRGLNACTGPIRTIVDRCTNSDVDARYKSVREIITDLETAAAQLRNPQEDA